jgi:hypothetical protein
MFKENTVFILGAGASNPYGYPLGAQLITDIVDNIEKDSIYVPIPNPNPTGYYFNENDKGVNFYKLDWFNQNKETFQDMVKKTQISNQNDYFRHENTRYIKSKLNNIEEFNKLKIALNTFAPVSIDSFLSHNPSFAEAGKIMIVYSLLKNENKGLFSRSNEDNWYSFLLNDLISNCADKPQSLLEDKLAIITFNYDTSLDHCIEQKLLDIEVFKDTIDDTKKTIAEKYLKEKLKIYHVYGSLSRESNCSISSKYGDYYVNTKSNRRIDDIELNCKRFLDSLFMSKNIRTILGERSEKTYEEYKQKYLQIIENARNIVFIGFGFDRDNLDQLGFPREFSEWQSLLRPLGIKVNGEKYRRLTIKWLNYDNRMSGLSRQFNRLDDGEGPRISAHVERRIEVIESTATRISDAYQNDFKLFLFE